LWGDRLKQPLLRGNGKMDPVPWGEAMAHVVARFKELTQAGKPVGVLGSARATNEENYLAGKLARVGLHTNNVDFSLHAACRPLFAGLEDVCGKRTSMASLNDVASSQTIVLIEGNLAESHPRAASAVMEAIESGAHLITLGPRTTQMARLSSLHLQTSPGNGSEVVNGLVAATLDLKLRNRVSATPTDGCDALRQDLKDTKRTEELRQAAEWIAGAERATFLLAVTCGQGDQPRRDAAALATLAAIAGHLEKSGSGLLLLLPRSNVRGACDMGVAAERLPGYASVDDESTQRRLQGLWGKKLPSDRGWQAEELLQHVSGLIVVADDPPSVLPMAQRAMADLQRLEFLVVMDAFVTPTAQIAHATLPIASFAETDGTLTNMEGRVQLLHAATEPPGKARAGWQVLAELCAGFGAGDSYSSARDVLREIAEAVALYVEVEQRLAGDGWSDVLLEDSDSAGFELPSTDATGTAGLASAACPHALVRDGCFDWGRDPFVFFSPTLSRDSQSERKLFPSGFVEISKTDADALNLGGDRRVKLSSVHGDAVVPIRIHPDLKPGVLSVPYAFRDHVASVLGTDGITAVNVGLP
jgi:predicted molibdopterin-dependent oxidoreductase YjgC